MSLRPPPTVADVPTFDRWIRESLFAVLKGILAGGGTGGGSVGPDLAAIEALTGQGVPQRVSEGVWTLVQMGEADNRNVIHSGEHRTVLNETCSVLSTYVEIQAGGVLEISPTGILDII